MITQIIKLAQSQKWIGVSPEVEIAKGKNQYVFTYSQLWAKIKRQWLKR
jgi:hypothetical protein